MKINQLFSQDWSEVTGRERNKVVFEYLNKSYGAYEIRTNYDTSLLKAFFAIAMLITICSVSIVISIDFSPIITDVPIPSDSPELKLLVENPVIPEEPKRIVKTITPVNKQDTEPKVIDEPETSNDKIEPDESNKNTNTNVLSDSGSIDPQLIPTENGNEEKIIDNSTDHIYEAVQVMPRFPGGEKELYRFIQKNIVYPETLIGIGAKGKVGILFIVDKDGQLKDISVHQGTKYAELNNEVLRIIKKMPHWEPGTQNGKPVRVKLILPVRFDLN